MKCSVENCRSIAFCRGLCGRHYHSQRKYGDASFTDNYVKPKRQCSVSGCCQEHDAKGYCKKHYKALIRHGDPLAADRVKPTTCKHCERPIKCSGLCASHYYSLHKYGFAVAIDAPKRTKQERIQQYKRDNPLRSVHNGMKSRCYNKNNNQYAIYGGRGISVCDRWLNGDGVNSGYRCFVLDMPNRLSGQTIERIDNDGDYTPENCRWATRKEQANNTRPTNNTKVLHRDQLYSIAELSEICGVKTETLRQRINKGWTIEEATSTTKRVNQYG